MKQLHMGKGMQMICKTYGAIEFKQNGKTVRYVWDYHRDIAVLESEMTKEQKELSEKARWKDIFFGNKL